MPNLVGIHDPSADRERLERDLGRMMAAVDLPAFGLTRRTAFGEGVAVGNVLTGVDSNLSQPVTDEATGVWLMLDGEILDADEQIAALRRMGRDPRGKDDAGVALDVFLAKGFDGLFALNGQWNVVIHDPRERLTFLVSDRIGSRILFYAADGPRFTFGSEVKGVVAGRSVSSHAGGIGLIQLLTSNQQVGVHTWLEGVRVVEPGTIVRLGREGRTSRRYWKFHFREGAPEMSEDDYADGFARRLRKAVDRAMRGHDRMPLAITLSGGLDSRSIALSIDRAKLPIRSITYGDPESADVRFAAQLARLIGLDHHYIEEERARLEAESAATLDRLLGPAPSGKRGFYAIQADRIAWRSEAMTMFYGLASSIWHPLYAKWMRLMLNGACGDALTGSHLSPKMLLSPPRHEVTRIMRSGVYWQSRELVSKVLAPGFVDRWWPELEPAFEETVRDIDADEAFAIANVWDMENRQRRGAFSTFTMERYFCTVRAPFIDYELSEFLASIPSRYRFQQRVYKRMIVRCFPEARDVPWAYTEGKITDSPFYEFGREVALFAYRRAQRMLPGGKQKKNAWEFRDTAALMRGDPELFRPIEDWIASSRFPSETFDAGGIKQIIERFRAGEGRSEYAAILSHLMALAKAHRWWLEGGVVPIPPEADPASFGVVPVPLKAW